MLAGPWRRRRSGEKIHAPFLTAAAALATVLVSQGAVAQGLCDRREYVIDRLAENFRETPVAIGITTEGSLVEVLTDAQGESWTIIVTSSQGLSCLLLSGEGWKKLHQIALEPEF